MKTNDSSHYSPLNPIWDLPYDPKGGSGIINATIWLDWRGNTMDIKRLLAYTWSETVNGIEVEVEKPFHPHAKNIEEDIYNAMKQEIKFDTLNYITK